MIDENNLDKALLNENDNLKTLINKMTDNMFLC